MAFIIPPDDCLVVLEFRDGSSLRDVAARLHLDPSALVRKVQRIAAEHRLLEKIKGRWVLTAKGHLLNRWTEDTLISQQRLLDTKPQLRISSSMWLAEQVIVPFSACLNRETNWKYNWLILTPNRNFETELLEGTADFIITCGAPVDPLIAYKKILPEEWVAIAPKSWAKELKNLKDQKLLESLLQKDFVRHIDLNAEEFLNIPERIEKISVSVDNLIGIRSAVAKGYGWSIVPRFAVLKELRTEEITELPLAELKSIKNSHLSLWWSRGRKEHQQLAPTLQQWLLRSLQGS
ncbi:MAG: LysR substrate-binding domain-containing protein [Bdellovibrio sp.]